MHFVDQLLRLAAALMLGIVAGFALSLHLMGQLEPSLRAVGLLAASYVGVR